MSASWPENQALTNLLYERGEGRYKHVWKHDRAGFVPSGRGAVGKCHRSITQDVASGLLRSGIVPPDPFEDPSAGTAPPERIYNVYRGVPYVAVPTRPGTSYHGYPHRGRLEPGVVALLRERAEQEGTLREYEKWLRSNCAS